MGSESIKGHVRLEMGDCDALKSASISYREEKEKMSRPLFKRNSSWDALQDSSIVDQCTDAPFFFKESLNFLEKAREALEKSQWPGFLSFPLVSPVCPENSSPSSDGPQMQLPTSASNSKSWKISLNVSHFCPEEISVRITEGYLEVSGEFKFFTTVYNILLIGRV